MNSLRYEKSGGDPLPRIGSKNSAGSEPVARYLCKASKYVDGEFPESTDFRKRWGEGPTEATLPGVDFAEVAAGPFRMCSPSGQAVPPSSRLSRSGARRSWS